MQEKDQKNGTEPAIDMNTDSDIPGTSHLQEPFGKENEAEKWQLELGELKDKYLRQAAEFENFRKRSAREKIEWIQTAGKDVIIPLLDVLDDCDRAQKQLETSEDIAAIREGVMLVFNKLRAVLQGRGIKEMESIQHAFDPDMHEAIAEIPATTGELKGKVLDEVQKGYYLNDKIIRFAKVVVGK